MHPSDRPAGGLPRPCLVGRCFIIAPAKARAEARDATPAPAARLSRERRRRAGPAGFQLVPSFRGSREAREPGTPAHGPCPSRAQAGDKIGSARVHGFRVSPCGRSRNDSIFFRQLLHTPFRREAIFKLHRIVMDHGNAVIHEATRPRLDEAAPVRRCFCLDQGA